MNGVAVADPREMYAEAIREARAAVQAVRDGAAWRRAEAEGWLDITALWEGFLPPSVVAEIQRKEGLL